MQVHDGPQWMWKLRLQFLYVPLGHIGPHWENGVPLDRTFSEEHTTPMRGDKGGNEVT